ncbi:MAG: NADH-quinone oxidoreductase subunit I [Nitrososphaerota archaeon]|nr:NADH-quinone oxidoreductase subunit I [Nitrososphaerota archaeon]
MKPTTFARGFLVATWAGAKHLLRRRMTLMYPHVENYPTQQMYAYDPKKNVAVSGWRGRHYLDMDKCTGCQLCFIACENISEAIEMIPLPETDYPQNKKKIFPSVDYGRCVFCGFCVDACPFYALYMTPNDELSETERNDLYYSPAELSKPPPLFPAPRVNMKLDLKRGAHDER